jgi:death on curing protein
MTFIPRFLAIDEVLEIHAGEIARSGGAPEMRDVKALESALGAPMASFGGGYLMDLFEMAATYVQSIAVNHPFLDGNKRTAAASALTFLLLNGYEVEEEYDEELADKVLGLLAKRTTKDDFAVYFRQHCHED